jgi:hypothetical protein
VKRLVVAVALVGCNDAVTLAITSDRPIPQGLDAICVGVADSVAGGGHFGRRYQLSGKLATLPQTLRVDPGGASSALAWVRGDRAGVPVQLASAPMKFNGDVSLALDACAHGPAAVPALRGTAVGPASAKLAASEGQGGVVVIAAGAGGAQVIDAKNQALIARDAPALPAGIVKAVVAADLDGDCDDDVIIATDSAPPEIWIRDGDTFVDRGLAIGGAAASAVVVADVDADGDLDVIVGGGASLALYLNDGGGNFTLSPMLAAGGHVTAVSALAIGDVDGDGFPDLIVGQANAPLAAWHGGEGGQLTFTTAIVGAMTYDVEAMTLADADGDFDPDLALAVTGAEMHLLVDRDGKLEDQSYPRLPQPVPTVHAIAIGDWDDGCPPDAVVATDAGAPTWRGQPGGMFAPEADTSPAATDVLMTDIDDDGMLDAIYATPDGVQWLAR